MLAVSYKAQMMTSCYFLMCSAAKDLMKPRSKFLDSALVDRMRTTSGATDINYAQLHVAAVECRTCNTNHSDNFRDVNAHGSTVRALARGLGEPRLSTPLADTPTSAPVTSLCYFARTV